MDEAQGGREKEESGRVGGRDRDGVPGVGGELGRDGRRRRPVTGDRTTSLRGCPPSRFGEGGLSSCPPAIFTYLWIVRLGRWE